MKTSPTNPPQLESANVHGGGHDAARNEHSGFASKAGHVAAGAGGGSDGAARSSSKTLSNAMAASPSTDVRFQTGE